MLRCVLLHARSGFLKLPTPDAKLASLGRQSKGNEGVEGDVNPERKYVDHHMHEQITVTGSSRFSAHSYNTAELCLMP